jgi:hypothetical protein
MQIEVIEAYKASDGEVFQDRIACIRHEMAIRMFNMCKEVFDDADNQYTYLLAEKLATHSYKMQDFLELYNDQKNELISHDIVDDQE